MGNTNIPYADKTWDVTRGCSHVSAGCENCWAASLAHRFSGPGLAFEGLTRSTKHGPRWTGEVRTLPAKLAEPLHWCKPQTVFVCSKSDLFHESVPFPFIAAVYGIMAACPQHTFLVFTKRTHRMREWFEWISEGCDDELTQRDHCHNFAVAWSKLHTLAVRGNRLEWPLPNLVHVGSCENQQEANKLIPELIHTPAARRYVSLEPLLGPIDISIWLYRGVDEAVPGDPDYDALDGVIVGGESGRNSRPCQIEWIKSIVQQARAVPSVKLYVKQMGSRPTVANYEVPEEWEGRIPFTYVPRYQGEDCPIILNDRTGADMSEWPEDLRIRDFEKVRTG